MCRSLIRGSTEPEQLIGAVAENLPKICRHAALCSQAEFAGPDFPAPNTRRGVRRLYPGLALEMKGVEP
jgi:hypothetical protein